MGTDFSHDNFPPLADPANQETGKAELYPKTLQDETNDIYKKNKVLPRRKGTDYTN